MAACASALQKKGVLFPPRVVARPRKPDTMLRTLYRDLLKVGARLDKEVVRLTKDGLTHKREVEKLKRFLPRAIDSDHDTVCDAVRASFGRGIDTDQEAMDISDIEKGFAAYRRMSERLKRIQSPSWQPKPKHVKLALGQIYRHKRWGYRGVIIDWFPECPADNEWVKTHGPFEKGTDQAFYRTLVDTADRPSPFMTLAAQENLIPLDGEQDPVAHPFMEMIFEDFVQGKHILKHDMWERYPEDQ